jgi:hypothetical protein
VESTLLAGGKSKKKKKEEKDGNSGDSAWLRARARARCTAITSIL